MVHILAVLLKANLGISSLLGNPVVIIVAIVVVALVIGIIGMVVLRGGKSKKNKSAATPGGPTDWQRQGQQAAPGGWGQQAQATDNPWGQPAQQAGGWGVQGSQQPAQQQQPGAWGQSAPQQAGGWGMQGSQQPAQQQQPGAWGQSAPQQAGGWGTPGSSSPQQQPAWGTQGSQQQQPAWGSQPGSPAAQDPWAQVQPGQQPQPGVPAWGTQSGTSSSSQQGPTSYGSSGSSGQAWGQTPQSADPWGTPAAQPQAAQQGSWPQSFQQPSSAPFAAGNNPSTPPWQQQGPSSMGGPAMAQQEPTYGGEADRTIVRNTGPQGRLGVVRVEEGKEPGRIYEVRKDSLSIGRSRESDIFLEDLAVSRLHASIVNMGSGNYGLKDEGSANGTKVNGQLVAKYQTYPLQEGDKIQLGQTVLVFAKR
jgi:pSer/pThr/pTyr-binding forkhead associated (FHA) protein